MDVSGLASGVSAIAAAESHLCADDGRRGQVLGVQRSGQLGDGTTIDRTVPVDVVGFGGGSAGPLVDPPLITATLAPGKSITQTITVTTGNTPVPSIDVVFAIARTSSMGDDIAAAKSKAVEIMDGIRSKVPDSWFGLVSFMDYPHSYSYLGYSATYGSEGDRPWIPHYWASDPITMVSSWRTRRTGPRR